METAGVVIFSIVGLQGLLLAAFLMTRGTFQYQTLATICFILAIDSLSHLNWLSNYVHLLNHGNLIALGPLLFVLYRSLGSDTPEKFLRLHIAPFILLKLILLWIELSGFEVARQWSVGMSFFMAGYNVTYNLILIYYLLQNKATSQVKSKLLLIALIFLLGWLIALSARFFDLYVDVGGGILWKSAYGMAGIFVYYLTFSFLKTPKVFGNSSYAYQKNEGLEKALTEVLEKEKLYLNPEMKRDDLAVKLGISNHELSFVLSNNLGIQFNDLINRYRIEEFVKRMNTTELETKTISSLGLECGFGSKATFQRAFKKHTGVSPSEYLKKGVS